MKTIKRMTVRLADDEFRMSCADVEGADAHPLARAGILRPVGICDPWKCSACDEPCFAEVPAPFQYKHDDGSKVWGVTCDADGTTVDVRSQYVAAIWSYDARRMAEMLGRLLYCNGVRSERTEGVWKLGESGNPALRCIELYLMTRIKTANEQQVAVSILAERPSIIIAGHISDAQLLKGIRERVVPLVDILSVEGKKLAVDIKPLLSIAARNLQPLKAPEPEQPTFIPNDAVRRLPSDLMSLAGVIEDFNASKRLDMFGNPRFIQYVCSIASTAGQSMVPADTSRAEEEWTKIVKSLSAMLRRISEETGLNTRSFLCWLKCHLHITDRMAGPVLSNIISSEVVTGLREKCKETGIACHAQYAPHIEIMFDGEFDAARGLPESLPFSGAAKSGTTENPVANNDSLSLAEITKLLDFFESGGYVLDGTKLTDKVFNKLTERAIGVRVKDLYASYGLSKGKALRRYVETNWDKARTLFQALLEYYELNMLEADKRTWDMDPDNKLLGGNRSRKNYEWCKHILTTTSSDRRAMRRMALVRSTSPVTTPEQQTANVATAELLTVMHELKGTMLETRDGVAAACEEIKSEGKRTRAAIKRSQRSNRERFSEEIQESAHHIWIKYHKSKDIQPSNPKRKLTHEDVFNYAKQELAALAEPITSAEEFERCLGARSDRIRRNGSKKPQK